MARPNWSRPLARPLVIPTVIHLSTLAEVRALLDRHLPPQTRNKPTWRYVRKKLDEVAYGGNMNGCGRSSADRAEVGGDRIPTGVKPYVSPATVAMLYVIACSMGAPR